MLPRQSYEDVHRLSVEKPELFWAREAERLHWFRKWDRVLDDSKAPFFGWFPGGQTNLCYNAVDRHVLAGRGSHPAIIWESPETGESRTMTFGELLRAVQEFAAVLRRQTVSKGDRVLIYLPMVPEALVATLACARIGAVHSIVFAGFSGESLAHRIEDSQSEVIVCADGSRRKGKAIDLKAIVDHAVQAAST
ncbi:MAG: AMP-binding protein, partial [Candidatus Bipolaricaulota bacterium]|nr:AMP-binding protein [Candidatus Bipolaricaulota bacterium]